jgi:hypothetical protein
MNPIKRIIIEETAKVLKEMKHRKRVKDVASNLYESVKTADMVKDNPKKYRLAKKLVSISENKFIKERERLKESHEYEDESEMAKAQLAAIIEKSEELLRMMNGVNQLEDWLQYKLSIAENYIDAVHGYIKYFNGEDDMEDQLKKKWNGMMLKKKTLTMKMLNTLTMKKTLKTSMISMMTMTLRKMKKKMILPYKEKYTYYD